MKRADLVDVAVPMATFFSEQDEAHPEDVLRRRREAASRLLTEGFSREEVEALYGKVLPAERPSVRAVRMDDPPPQMAAFLRK